MTSTITEHYANHLAPIYSWMVGDFDQACDQASSFYSEISLPRGKGAVAFDLGCGHGIYSIPLALRGYQVRALDTSTHLLSELKTKIGNLPIQTIEADLTEFSEYQGSDSVKLIACMGDTLTHLSSFESVIKLIRDAGSILSEGGWLTLSFRDYSNELTGVNRFIPVQSDEKRIHTCFLEYHPNSVLVHDMIQTQTEAGWQTAVSAYQKLRLQPSKVLLAAESSGLSLIHQRTVRGMLFFAFRKLGAMPGA